MYGVNGIPDIICCVSGLFLGMEVKRPGEKPTAIQLYQHEGIRKANGGVHVVKSLLDAQMAVEEIRDKIRNVT